MLQFMASVTYRRFRTCDCSELAKVPSPIPHSSRALLGASRSPRLKLAASGPALSRAAFTTAFSTESPAVDLPSTKVLTDFLVRV